MSHDGRVVAIATDVNINVYNADTAELMDTLEAVHSGDYLYTHLLFFLLASPFTDYGLVKAISGLKGFT